MNNSDFQTLTKYETELHRAMYLGYTRNITTIQRRELADIYNRVFNAPGTDILSSCNSCLHNGLKKLAQAYYQQKEKLDNQELSKETSIQEYGTIDGLPVPDDTTPAPKPKSDKKTTTKKK